MRVFLTFFTLLFGLFFSTHQALAQQSPTYCTPHSDCELVYGHTTGAIPAQLSIVRVEFNGQFTNYSNWQRCCCINNGYQDFTEVEGIVEQAGTYDIKVIAQPYSNEWSATGYTCQIWVDWNRNYEFEDTELTIIPGDQVAAFETFTLTFPGQIVVPHNAFTGETRMRIRVHHSNNFPKSLKGDLEAADSLLGNPGIPGEPYGNKWLDAVPDTMPGPCDSSRTGETEDYTLLVYSEAPPRTGYCTASGPENCRGSRLDLDGTGLPTKYEFVHIDTVRIEGANGTSIDNPSSLQECQADGSYSDYTREFQYPPSWTIDSAYQIYVSRV
ncbi:MAG: GEVED domain-containing protein, partial [Luteibaculum sp.]